MHHFIFPTQDTWISSGSSKIDGTSFKDQNFGRDQILEVKKEFYNNSFDHQTRVLVQFSGTEFTELSKSVADGTITSPKYYLKLYEGEGNTEIQGDYTLAIQPISQSWIEGTGKNGDSPKNTNGCSWDNRSNPSGGSEVPWADAGVTILNVSSSTQAFSNQSPDVNVEVTDMVNMWLQGQEENYGMLVRFSGSQETDVTTYGHLKFFSRNTHTIYQPKLEVRWEDSSFDSTATGSLNELTMSGLADNYLYMRGLREEYREGERVKFRVGARKRYIQKTFSTSVQTISSSWFPSDSGSYAIKDVATDEFIVPFSSYTSMSLDSNGMYFNQWMDGFYPDRVYKFQLKLKYTDGQEQVFDDDYEFIVKRK
jgi:hypothetical protein